MFRMYMVTALMRKVPIVIYSHSIIRTADLRSTERLYKEIPNLLVAGEAAGGIHGRNRLMEILFLT